MRFGASSIGFVANRREEEERVRDKNGFPTKRKGKEMLGSGMSSLLVTTRLIVNDTVNEKEYRARFCVKVFICNCKSPSKLFRAFPYFSLLTPRISNNREGFFFSFLFFFGGDGKRNWSLKAPFFFLSFLSFLLNLTLFAPALILQRWCVSFTRNWLFALHEKGKKVTA